MNVYQIEPLVLGRFPDYEKSWLLFNKCCGEKTEALVLAFLIRGAGKNVLVDTGCGGRSLRKELGARGLGPDDISCIVLTHLHRDCCGGGSLFPQAEFFVQRQEVQYAAQPLPCHAEEYGGSCEEIPCCWRKIEERFVLVDGERELYPGLKLIPLPGHSPGFQGVVAETESGGCVIAGDSVPLYENWTGIKDGALIPSAVHVNTAHCLLSFSRMEREGDLLLAGRDPRAAEKICIKTERGGGSVYVKL